MKKGFKNLIFSQFIILLAGTIFAWISFGNELKVWFNQDNCQWGCPISITQNPFLTPFFYSALLFTLAFIISAFILKKIK